MSALTKRAQQIPSTVLILPLSVARGNEPVMGVVEPWVAVRDGRHNHTIPGGGVLQLGARHFEDPITAMIRELNEETGSPEDNLYRLGILGEPQAHCTGNGKEKFVLPAVAILQEPFAKPRLADEIAHVRWGGGDNTLDLLLSMNSGKLKLVLMMMLRASQERYLFPCMRRFLRDCIAELEPSLLAR